MNQAAAVDAVPQALRKPRVVHLVEKLSGGGAESAVRLVCAGLRHESVDANVISVYQSGLDCRGLQKLDVPVVDLARRSRSDYAYFPRLVKTLREIDPDVVHAHLHTGQYPGRVAALIAGARSIVLTIHGREPGGPIRWVLDRYLHARTTRFIVFTEGQRLRLARAERIAPERIVVIPNGVSATPLRIREDVRRELGLPNNAFVVYSAARLAEQKNHAALLDAMALLEQEGLRDIHLVLAGAGPLDNTLRGRAAQLGLTQRVVFLGFRSDASALCPGMDIFALPSHWEGMPLALGEAMIAGLAPLVTPWQDHGDFVTDGRTGYVSRGFDGPALAAAIRRAWSSGATRDAIAREARRAARAMFDGAATVRAHAALYRELSQIGGAAS